MVKIPHFANIITFINGSYLTETGPIEINLILQQAPGYGASPVKILMVYHLRFFHSTFPKFKNSEKSETRENAFL